MSFEHYQNPSQLACFNVCRSCFRCEDKGTLPACNGCSGRNDPDLRRDPHDQMDRCRCAEGIMQYRLKSGRLVQRRFMSSPYGGEVTTDTEDTDERDWNSYINEKREQLNDPEWDPIQFLDGTPVNKRLDR